MAFGVDGRWEGRLPYLCIGQWIATVKKLLDKVRFLDVMGIAQPCYKSVKISAGFRAALQLVAYRLVKMPW